MSLPGFDVLRRFSGILALLISLIHPAMEAWKDFRRAPSTEATNRGASVQVRYDPVARELDFKFPVILTNYGNADDFLHSPSISLEYPGVGAVRPLPAAAMELLDDEDQPVKLPYLLRNGAHRLDVAVRVLLDISNASAIRSAGRRRLEFQFQAGGRSAPYRLDYCFEFAAPVVEALSEASALWSSPFRVSSCYGGLP